MALAARLGHGPGVRRKILVALIVTGLAAGAAPAYTGKIHNSAGNLLLGDGSVQQVTSGRMKEQLRDAANSIGDQQFAFPLKK